MELENIRLLSLQAFSNLREELDIEIDQEINDETNILDILDSMDIVNLIMETESLLEKEVGNYTPLATELTFDADMSPLLSFKSWLNFIKIQLNS
jgi:hypothetical protein